MLSAENIEVRYGQAVAVSMVSLQVPDNSWVAVVGANGAGKTSLLRGIMGLVRHRGRVRIRSDDVSALPAWERQRRGIGYVPEGRQIFAQMTVEENLRVGGHSRDQTVLRRGLDNGFAMFPRLAERRAQMAATLSGGEQQMLALARALMIEPAILLIDEISWGLMPILVAQVFEHLQGLHEKGLAILQVEQNTREVLRHAQYAYVMESGTIAFEGSADEINNDARIIESYVGA